MDALRARQADIWLPKNVLSPLGRLLRGADTHYKDIDVSILNLTAARVRELRGIIDASRPGKDGANLRLSFLDMIELTQISTYAESFLADLGDTGLEQNDAVALTVTLDRIRERTFPKDETSV